MALDIANLKDFYDSPRLTVGALRYELPYLDRFHDKI
jgi:hypothetical protein